MPIHHSQKWGSGYRRTKDDIHHGYLDMPSTPLFAFGHGLSYTTFEYSPLKLESHKIDVSGELRASLTVKNTGKRRGTEVVQLYAADTASGVTLPAQTAHRICASRTRAWRVRDRHVRSAVKYARVHGTLR